ncbi:MAG TPA: T9SS type A sorting domain-containing protein [Saprospiraceae bacterium]|nr:T9SS type A sorting domain-containing protein [Saprospiraceae bacterium]
MRTIRFFFVLGLITASCFCQAQYILTLHLSEMDPYLGKSFYVRVTENGSGWEVGRKTISPIDTADFSLDLYVLLEPHSYNIDFYVDVNDNGAYDAPLTDHAWRRVLINPEKDTTVNFHPGKTFTDIAFPNVFPYNTYEAVWGGKWKNLTFGSTDSIEAGFDVRCDSIVGFFKTKGVFGNPAPVEYHSVNPRPAINTPVPDTLRYAVIPPWSGDIYFTNGDLYGDLSQGPLGFQFRGTVGEKQFLGLYTVSSNGTQFANGFFYVRELEILSSTDVLAAAIDELSDVSCTGLNDGSISIVGVGGTPEYSFLWEDASITSTITLLAPGQYNVTITDGVGCQADASFEIKEPEPVEVVLDCMFEVSCNGLDDGSISIAGAGGTPGYTYAWSNDETTAAISSLAPGSYSVTITDSNGCTANASFDITEPEPLSVVISITSVSCFGFCDGIIDLSVSGGQPNYTYIWNTGNATQDLGNLCDGVYFVTVVDAAGCTVDYSVIVSSPLQLTIDTIEVIHETNNHSNGQIIIGSVLIPNGLYSINNGPYQSSNIFTGLTAGVYTVSIKLQDGCIIESEVEIQNITSVNELHARLTLYPNPASSEIFLQSDISVYIEMLDIHGRKVREMQKSKVHHIQTANLARGMYILRVSDGEGRAYRKILLE